MALFILVVLAAVGCGTGSDSETASLVAATARPTTSAGDHEAGVAPAGPPARICLLDDKSGSALPNLVPQLTTDDLAPVVDLLRRSGGELAFGLINASSDHPLVRLRVEIPPAEPSPPAELMAEEPAEPAPTGNALKDKRARDQWAKDHAAWQGKFDAWHKRAYDAWETDSRAWQVQTEAAISQFVNAITPLLAEGPNGYTDVVGGLKRCDLFGNEPAPWPTAKLWFVLATDGEETLQPVASGVQPITLLSQPTILIINAAAVSGILGPYQPIPFEAIAAAIDFIVHQEVRP